MPIRCSLRSELICSRNLGILWRDVVANDLVEDGGWFAKTSVAVAEMTIISGIAGNSTPMINMSCCICPSFALTTV